jgi:hypothetical protein
VLLTLLHGLLLNLVRRQCRREVVNLRNSP